MSNGNGVRRCLVGQFVSRQNYIPGNIAQWTNRENRNFAEKMQCSNETSDCIGRAGLHLHDQH